MWECTLGGVTVDLCAGMSECWCMCSRNKFGCRFWEMRVFVCAGRVSGCVKRVRVTLCVRGVSMGVCVGRMLGE